MGTLKLRRLAFIHATLLVVFASIGLSTFISTDAYADFEATWDNQSSITSQQNIKYSGPNTGPSNTYRMQATGRGECFGYIEFDANIEKATSATFVRQEKASVVQEGGGCRDVTGSSERVSLSNTLEDVGGLKDEDATADTEAGTGIETCNVAGIGWIVCPVSWFIAQITDAAYEVVESLLVFQVGDKPFDTSTNNTLYTVWSNVRNFANIAFIIAFFIIIFSQATSIGLGNYGIKKMLPRLVFAAIMVNISYYLCLFAIDISNIIGAGMSGILTSALDSTGSGDQPGLGLSSIIANILAVGGLATGAALLGTAASSTAAVLTIQQGLFAIAALIIGPIVLAILVALIVLLGRQAFLIILIILSPLAFVAYILPNTEDWFNRWRKIFMTLLIFYPLMAVLFKGSQVAAEIMRDVSENAFVDLFSIGVQAIPLFATPFIIQFSGNLLGRVAGIVNNPAKGPIDGMTNKLRDRAGIKSNERHTELMGENNANNRFARPARRRLQRKVDFTKEKAISETVAQEELDKDYAKRVKNDPSLARKIGGGNEGAIMSVQAGAQATVDKIEKGDIETRKFLYDKDFKPGEVKELAQEYKTVISQDKPDEVSARALQEMLFGMGNKGRTEWVNQTRAVDEASDGKFGQTETGMALRRDALKTDLKGSSADGYGWAVQGGSKSFAAVSADKATWENLSIAHYQGQVGPSMTSAVESTGLSTEKASEILQTRGSEKMGAEANILQNHVQGLPLETTPKQRAEITGVSIDPGAAPQPQNTLNNYTSADLSQMPASNIQMAVSNAGGVTNMTNNDLSKIVSSTTERADMSEMNKTIQSELKTRNESTAQSVSQSASPSSPTDNRAGNSSNTSNAASGFSGEMNVPKNNAQATQRAANPPSSQQQSNTRGPAPEANQVPQQPTPGKTSTTSATSADPAQWLRDQQNRNNDGQ